jgi:hypothetical protein
MTAYARIWRHSRATGSAKVILLALAELANDLLEAAPPVSTLMQMAGISERQTRLILADLTAKGEILPVGAASRGVVRYRIICGESAATPVTDSTPVMGNTPAIHNTPATGNRGTTAEPLLPIAGVEAPTPVTDSTPQASLTRVEDNYINISPSDSLSSFHSERVQREGLSQDDPSPRVQQPDLLAPIAPPVGTPAPKKPHAKPTKPESLPRGSRMREDWTLPQDWREEAIRMGLPWQDVDRAAEDFRDYWLDVSGEKGVKLGWRGTWRNRVRYLVQRLDGGNRGSGPTRVFDRRNKPQTTSDLAAEIRRDLGGDPRFRDGEPPLEPHPNAPTAGPTIDADTWEKVP